MTHVAVLDLRASLGQCSPGDNTQPSSFKGTSLILSNNCYSNSMCPVRLGDNKKQNIKVTTSEIQLNYESNFDKQT